MTPPNWLWGYLVPVGLLLLTWGGLPPEKARRVTPLALLSAALGVLGYWAVGFALHLGGAHAVNPQDAGLAGLDRMLPLIPGDPGWGIVGLAGFLLSGSEITPSITGLFLAYLPLVVSAVCMVTLALSEARRWVMIVSALLVATVVFPLPACWAWGSGWLAHLGETFSLGHGYVDFGGSSLVLGLPAAFTLGILLLQPRSPVGAAPAPPLAHSSLLANLGVLFLGIGWTGWTLSGPFHTTGVNWDWNQAALSALLGMAGAVLSSELYAWLITGELDALIAARGIAAGWAVLLAGAPFVPGWAALILGVLAGLVFPFVHHFVEVGLRLRDPAATIALGLTAGSIGVLGPALLADGNWGQGWNGIGALAVGEPTKGIVGLFIGGGTQQLVAQFAGFAVIMLWGLAWGGLLGFIAHPRWPSLKHRVPQALELAAHEEPPVGSRALESGSGSESLQELSDLETEAPSSTPVPEA